MRILTCISRLRRFLFGSIRIKLMFSYVILISTPLIILTAVTYFRFSRSYGEQIEYAANQAFLQANQFIQYKMNSLIKASDVIHFSPDVQTILSRRKDEIEGNIIQQNKDMIYLDNFLYSLKNQDVYRLKLYVPDWLTYSNQEINFAQIEQLKETAAYDRLLDKKEKVLWMPPQSIPVQNDFSQTIPVVSLIRKIHYQEELTEYIGFIQVFMLQSMLDDILMKANITNRGVVYITNRYNELIATSDVKQLSQMNVKEQLEPFIGGSDEYWRSITLNKQRFLYQSSEIEHTDWYMIAVIPYAEILEQSNKVMQLMLILFVITCTMAYGIAYLISRFLTKRLTHLTKAMVSVYEGNLDIKIEDVEHDEIGQLKKSFSYMLGQIKLLLNEKFQNGMEIKSAELKALQAQINPHFLYNTLDLAVWKSLDNDVPEIADILRALAKFYKLSLNKGQDFVSLQDELEHVKQYVKIQNMRFENKIFYECSIEESLLKYQIPKIILQPIVENAIIHGIRNHGMIRIEGALNHGSLILTVIDDGVGIEPSKLKTILYDIKTNESHGYGIKNIHERIQLCYGKDYGLSFESNVGSGTKVTVIIPAILGM